MTSAEIADSVLKYATSLDQKARVVVYVSIDRPIIEEYLDDDGIDTSMRSTDAVDHWDLATAVRGIADMLATRVEHVEERST